MEAATGIEPVYRALQFPAEAGRRWLRRAAAPWPRLPPPT